VLPVVAGVLVCVFSVVVSAAFFLEQPSSIATIATAASMQTPNRIQFDFVMVESPLDRRLVRRRMSRHPSALHVEPSPRCNKRVCECTSNADPAAQPEHKTEGSGVWGADCGAHIGQYGQPRLLFSLWLGNCP
jgi:hypothetical protein